ncbi:two-component response regulator-like APRR1 [Rhodamnia argentea]|uniref:Two-component response regulator-like APRR1 n=1 Tax=Rhodamnia argentea TaxID=178133 RepID=A0A8B8PIM1_9MYRT|nr:two-component response regulator-like APRR1 [Rhodamnia argentea]
MDCLELNLNKEIGDGSCVGGGGGGGGGAGGSVGNIANKSGGEGFIDRSKVRILLCDNDTESSEEVLTLLSKCSYQVTSVRSARQVIDALNAEGPDIDIILAEVDIPMNKGMKMLKYITRDKELRRIPVIMMSAQDEVSIVVKCLRLGAADYLVKPLRTNELLNLWTHMWRRRRMLGLVEKNLLSYDFDLIGSDPSDANTNSTTLLSDDTDDKSQKSASPEIGLSATHEDQSAAVAEPPLNGAVDCRPDVPGISDRRTGQCSSGPKKSELKVGESSAFFTYVKSTIVKNTRSTAGQLDGCASVSCQMEVTDQAEDEQAVYDPQVHENGEAWEKSSLGDDFPSGSSVPDSLSLERSCTPPGSADFPQQRNFMEKRVPQMPMHAINKPCIDLPGLPAKSTYPYYVPGVVNPVMAHSSAQVYQNNLHDLQNHATSAMLPHYSHLPQCPTHVNGMASFPYYPVGLCLQQGQMTSAHAWPSFGSSSISEAKTNKVDRREAALIKFRQKRKERCFDKKIRYVNRKRLAERRPRVRGQFVRKVNGVNVDLNGQPESADYDEDEAEYEDEDLALRGSTPNGGVS